MGWEWGKGNADWDLSGGRDATSDSFLLSSSVQAVFARGVAATGHFICVGEEDRSRALSDTQI